MTDQPSVEEARANIRLDLTMCGPEDVDALCAAVRRATLAEVREAVESLTNWSSKHHGGPWIDRDHVLAALARIAEGG